MPITIHTINALETYSVRHPVLRAGRPVESCAMDGDHLESTLHLGAFNREHLIGVATLVKSLNDKAPVTLQESQTCYQLRGMAVQPQQQGNGIGKLLIDASIEQLQQLHIDLLWFNARIKAVSFYQRLGFEKVGHVFEIKEVGPHYKMYKWL